MGTITEFTLARRYIQPNCLSVGKYRTQTFGGTQSVYVPDPSHPPDATVPVTSPGPHINWPPKTPNPEPGKRSVTIPAGPGSDAAGPGMLYLAASITLPSNQVTIEGEQVTLRGKLKVAINTPLAGKVVRLYRLKTNTCANKPSAWLVVGEALSGADGKFSFQFQLGQGKTYMYAAVYSASSGEVWASSAPLLVHNLLGTPRLVEKKDWRKTLPEILPVDVREMLRIKAVKAVFRVTHES